MKYNPRLHHRRSIRLKGFDYTRPGAYFVTMVTVRREELFGQVIYGEVVLSALGKIVHEEWTRSIGIRKEILLFEDEWVVMPNHVHAIVWIVEPRGTDGNCLDITRPQEGTQPDFSSTQHMPHSKWPTPQSAGIEIQRVPASLGSFIAGFKASVTSRARRELKMTEVWQRNYYEHIIRDEAELRRIWHYIDQNPPQWEKDQLYPR